MKKPPTLHGGDHFQVVPEPGSKKLVVYLTASGTKPRVFNFWRPGHAVKTHRIFANNKRAWYQQGIPGLGNSVAETVATIRAWADYLGATDIYTVGGSMGGYGAVLFGCLLDCPVLAFSWESELDLEGSRSRRLLSPGTVITYRDLAPLVAKARQPIFSIIGERDAVDAYSIDRIKHLPAMKVKSMVGVLHGPQSFLHTRERLVPLIEGFISGKDLPAMSDEEGDMFERPGFPELFFKTHQHHSAKRWEATVETGKAALDLLPTSDQCDWMVGNALAQLGRPKEAYLYLSAAIQPARSPVQFYNSLGYCLRLLGKHRDAIRIHRLAIESWPQHARNNYSLGLCYLAIGDRKNAGEAFQRAAQLAPNNETFRKRAAQFPL